MCRCLFILYAMFTLVTENLDVNSKVIPVHAVEALVEAPTFSDIRLIDGGKVVSAGRILPPG
jgi:hypothetical protein